MELIIESNIEKLENEIESHEILQLKVVDGWQPLDQFEGCGNDEEETQQPAKENFDLMMFDMDVDAGD